MSSLAFLTPGLPFSLTEDPAIVVGLVLLSAGYFLLWALPAPLLAACWNLFERTQRGRQRFSRTRLRLSTTLLIVILIPYILYAPIAAYFFYIFLPGQSGAH